MSDELNSSRPLSRRRYLQTTAATGIAAVAGLHGTGTTRADPGEQRWRFEPDGGLNGSPTVVDGTVFAHNSWEEKLYAIDANSGDIQWRSSPIDVRPGSPTVVDGTVYTTGWKLAAVDARIGSLQWTFEGQPGFFQGSPAVAGETVYTGLDSGQLYAIDAGTGTEEWTFELEWGQRSGNAEWSSPAVLDGTVYVVASSETLDSDYLSDRELFAVDAATGTEQWRFDLASGSPRPPTVANGTVYVCAGHPDESLYAIDAATGDEQWSFEAAVIGDSSPTVADGTVYVEGYAVDTETGTEEWDAGYNVYGSSPTVADGVVYIVTNDGLLRAVDADTGADVWGFETETPGQETSPIVVDGVVYAILDNALYALDAGVDGSSEGSRAWLGTDGHHDEWAHADQQIQIHREDNYTLDRLDFGLLGSIGAVTAAATARHTFAGDPPRDDSDGASGEDAVADPEPPLGESTSQQE